MILLKHFATSEISLNPLPYNKKRSLTEIRLPFGGDRGTRTLDLCVANASLSQLSYAPIALCITIRVYPYFAVKSICFTYFSSEDESFFLLKPPPFFWKK